MFSSKFDELRASIVPIDKLIVNNSVIPLDPYIVSKINCYAYALGILSPTNSFYSYQPGFTANIMCSYTSKELVSNVCTDLKNLKIKFRVIKLWEPIILKEDEYLIKLFFSPPTKIATKGGFHFIVKSKNKKWFHKAGWNNQPEFISSSRRIEPFKLIDLDENGDKAYYTAVCYFVIKSKECR